MYEAKAFSYEGDVTISPVPKKRVMTLVGLTMFLGIDRPTWYGWRKERADLANVIEVVEDTIYRNKFEGATAGLFSPTFIARDLGLVDKTEVKGAVSVVIEGKDADL